MPDTSPPVPSRQLLAAIVDSSDDAIISKNLDGIITSWNPGAERIFGYTAAEAVGQPILMLIPEDRLEEEPHILSRIRRGERIEHFETVRRRKDGKLLRISATISPIKDDSETIIGASKIARDITPQLELLDQLRRSEVRFRTTLGSIGDAVIATDRDGRIAFMNAVAEALTGWKEADARGRELPEVFHIINSFSRELVENPVAKVFRTGGIVGLANHTILVCKDGSECPIDDSGAPIRDSDGDIAGVVLVFRDVRERRASELASQRLAAIIHSSEDAIVSKNLDGTITSWNEGARRIFGYDPEEIIGRSILTLIPDHLRDEETRIINQLRSGGRIEHFETTRRTKDGRDVDISVSISPIRDEAGVVVGASKIARDVTQRKRTERELIEARQKLQAYAETLELRVKERTRKLQQSIGELEAFSFSLSHDLRAPLRAIQSFMQIFLEDHAGHLPPEGIATLQKVVASTQRMDRMVLDLLAFTQLSHQAVPIEVVDAEKVLDGLLHERPEFHPPAAQVEIVRPLPKVMGNEASLTQCLANLVGNAVKFVAPGVKPHVKIRAESRDGGIRLVIQDNGVGLTQEEQSQLFRMFHRLHGKDYPGTGIGLAIVRKAVERMGGTAGVESARGEGSRFWIQLPAPPSS